MSDTNRIGSVFAWSLVDIFWSAAYVIGCMGVMLFLNWRLALLVIVVVPAIALLTLYFQKKILAINRQPARSTQRSPATTTRASPGPKPRKPWSSRTRTPPPFKR